MRFLCEDQQLQQQNRKYFVQQRFCTCFPIKIVVMLFHTFCNRIFFILQWQKSNGPCNVNVIQVCNKFGTDCCRTNRKVKRWKKKIWHIAVSNATKVCIMDPIVWHIFQIWLPLRFRPIADALTTGQNVDPETFDSATICFYNVVGFNSLCLLSTPDQLITTLTNLCSQIDYLISSFNSYKVQIENFFCHLFWSSLFVGRNSWRHAMHC